MKYNNEEISSSSNEQRSNSSESRDGKTPSSKKSIGDKSSTTQREMTDEELDIIQAKLEKKLKIYDISIVEIQVKDHRYQFS